MLKRVSAILWRKCNQATFDTLNDSSKGQYHIGLSTHDYENFFFGVGRIDATEKGGFSMDVPLEPFTGPSPVEATSIKVRFMGDSSVRKDWNIPSQRMGTAYPLWRPGRGVSKVFKANANEFMLLIRDVDGKFHARWIHHADFSALPQDIQNILNRSEVGWEKLN